MALVAGVLGNSCGCDGNGAFHDNLGDRMKIKICTKCGEKHDQSPDNFYRDRRQPDGLKKYCKTCCESPKYQHQHLLKKPRNNASRRKVPIERSGNTDDAADCLSCYIIGGCDNRRAFCPKKNKLTDAQVKVYQHVGQYGPLNVDTIAFDLDIDVRSLCDDVAKLARLGAVKKDRGVVRCG